MYQYERVVRVADTDATGVIYFANVQKIALEALEECLRQRGHYLDQIFQESSFLLPIVHAEADYFAPIRVGYVLTVQMKVASIGTTSFSLSYHLCTAHVEQIVATVRMTHVIIDKVQGGAIPIPQDLLTFLETLM
jgi:1,4-dihydroxy-2-naphthoyl-CoA hydrolase